MRGFEGLDLEVFGLGVSHIFNLFWISFIGEPTDLDLLCWLIYKRIQEMGDKIMGKIGKFGAVVRWEGEEGGNGEC